MISICIPSMSNPEYCKCFVDSVRANSDTKIEICVHINNSTPDVYAQYKAMDIDILTKSHNNLGVAEPVNSLSELASGDYICYLNDDVYVAKGWDTALLSKVNRNIFHQYLCPVAFEPTEGNNQMNCPFDFGKHPNEFKKEEFDTTCFDIRTIKKDIISAIGFFMVSKELWKVVRGFDEAFWPGFGTDPDLVAKIYFRALKEGKPYEFRGVSDCLAYHFQMISNARLVNDGEYRRQSHMRFYSKYNTTVRDFMYQTIRIGEPIDNAPAPLEP